MADSKDTKEGAIAWPTLGICALCYFGFVVSTAFAQDIGLILACVILTLALTLYSSFNHEVLHGHPFKNTHVNTLLVFPAMGLMIPYIRFRDTHLAHHHDPLLTDPYDDPETNFVDPAVWAKWSSLRRRMYNWNNTLMGRMTIGPAISLMVFYAEDIRAMMRGDRSVTLAYVFHAAGLVPIVCWLVWVSEMPFWAYEIAVYCSLSILKIRTFLEHRAHEKARCRSVIIEDRGLLSFLFLKNNLHSVHHACPNLPWFKLQDHYNARRDQFLTRNEGYAYRSYAEVAGQFLLKPKDPVPHALWPQAPVEVSEPAQMSQERQAS